MQKSKLAVISDIHGNRWALEAVLSDVQNRGIKTVINLGDSLYGPLDPRGTADLLMAQKHIAVRGNQDRTVTEADHRSPTLDYVLAELESVHLEWLEAMPMMRVYAKSVCMFHAAPESDDSYLLWDVQSSGAVRVDSVEVARRIEGVQEPVVLCGHDHVPFTTTLPGGQLVVNPGSVGLPAYVDDEPYPHVMETHSPQARYAVLGESRDGWLVELVSVPYDWETAVSAAMCNGRPDWAKWLRTGEANILDADHQYG